jgi:hypothetical protein
VKSGAVYFQQTRSHNTCAKTLKTKIAPRDALDQFALATANPTSNPNAPKSNLGVLLCGKNTANK